MEVKAEVIQIQKLKDYFFVVPDYQREYVWKPEDNVERFITDIDNEFDFNPCAQTNYFLGSIIIFKRDEGDYEVVDGQQRLTTIIITLCTLRDMLGKKEQDSGLSDTAKEYQKKIQEILYEFSLEKGCKRSRLRLQYEDSKDYLEKVIQGKEYTGEVTQSIEKMKGAYDSIQNYLTPLFNESIDYFLEFIRYFFTKIELVVIQPDNLSSALKIFETVNERGVGLNAMDLLKNLIFSKAQEHQYPTIKELWKRIIDSLEKCGEHEHPLRFLRYFLMARYYDGILREDDIYKWITSNEGSSRIGYDRRTLDFAKELLRASEKYRDFILSTESLSDRAKYKYIAHIGFINKYKSRQHIVPLLALHEKFTEEDINYLAAALESVLFYNLIRDIQAKYNERTFSDWARSIRKLNSRIELEQFVETDIFKYVKNNALDFFNKFSSSSEHVLNPLYREKFVLGRIEEHIRKKVNYGDRPLTYYTNLQIEHIYPQTPRNEFVPNEFSNKFEYWSTVYKLGNITLVESPINQALNQCNDLSSDKWYEDKKRAYLNSEILLTNFMNPEFIVGKHTALNRFKDEHKLTYGLWNKNSVIDRQKALIQLACEVWTIGSKKIDISEFN